MKKNFILVLVLIMGMSCLFADSKWDEGYLAGYNDALKGKANLVESRDNSEKDTEDIGEWEFYYYVDEFDDLMDYGYITQIGNGVFSNSISNKELLWWQILVDEYDVAFSLFERGTTPVKSFGNTISYILMVKDESGNVKKFDLSFDSDRFYVIENLIELIDIMKREETIKLYIESTNEFYQKSYNLGELDCAGFNAAIVKYLGK